MSGKSYADILSHYLEGISNDDLLDEAIATLEALFSYMSLDELEHRSRTYAIPYLALINEKKKRDNA